MKRKRKNTLTHGIYKAFHCCPALDVRGVFLDISKAFDKVWHEGLLFKLEQHGLSGNFLSLVRNFLVDRQQRVVLNGQSSSWKTVTAGVPQGSVLGPLFFLLYINDLPIGLSSDVKIFADDTSIFSVVKDSAESYRNLSNDLEVINLWAHQWKMSFNPDPSKQAVEVIFSRKRAAQHHQPIYFNNSPVAPSLVHKHLGLFLDNQLNFQHHLKEKISKANKGIGVIRKLSYYLPRGTLLTIYKMFVRPHLDYCDVIYDRPNNDFLKRKLESVQYNAALAITGGIRGTSMEKLFDELGLEFLADRRWMRRLTLFYKIKNELAPSYLCDLIPTAPTRYQTRNKDSIRVFTPRTDLFSFSFFPYTSRIWHTLDPNIRELPSLTVFKKALLKFMRPYPSQVYGIHNFVGIKFLTRLRLGLSHLREHKFRHDFRDTLNPLCSCNIEPETTSHYLLRCLFFSSHRKVLFDSLHDIDHNMTTNISDIRLTKILLYGSSSYDLVNNANLLKAVIHYILSSERFNVDLI